MLQNSISYSDNNSIRTANYTGNNQRMMEGKEHLLLNEGELPYAMIDFWRWAYSELLRNTQRGVLAEYIVKSALEFHNIRTNEEIRSNKEPKIVFSIAPARVPDDYIVKTSLLDEKFGKQKSITLSKVIENSEGGGLQFEEVGKVLKLVCEGNLVE